MNALREDSPAPASALRDELLDAAIETESDSMRNRISVLESRVTDVEKRLNLPPAA